MHTASEMIIVQIQSVAYLVDLLQINIYQII